MQFHLADQLVELVDDIQIERDAQLHRGIGEALGNMQLRALGRVAELLGKRRQVVLGVQNLQVGDQLGEFVHQVHPPAEQVAGFAHPLRIGIRQGEVTTTEQMGDLVRIDAIILGLSAMDELHVQGVTDDERNVVLGAPIRQPVPAKHAFDADDHAVTKRRDGLEKCFEVARQVAVAHDGTRRIQDTDVHGPCVQVDAAIESVWLLVESHDGLLGLGGT